ncbi:transcriptional regulator [Flavobacterium sp.]|uniref:winged helix-turn-helix domain-containing protein n=1 Tax=Flavobacterium sp. TaxID=239 RepID=UPI0026090E1A|nr:transcriptional regulator [Flavobacterium sp.]
MFNDLDPILHSQLRLAIVSLLIGLEEAEFVYLKEKTNTSAGNLSLQLDKLKKAGYVTITKGFKGSYPLTTCKITKIGIIAFEKYVENLKQYIDFNKK